MVSNQQQFEWDPIKDQINFTNHNIRFSTAAKIFDGPILEEERYPSRLR